MTKKLYLFAYDIANNKTRVKVLRLIKAHAIGGQKSLYECLLTNKEISLLLNHISQIIDSRSDRVLLLRLDPRAKVHTFGVAVEPTINDFFYF